VAFHSTFLNNRGATYDNLPDIFWAVAYYPYPPEIKSSTKVDGSVKLIWDFNQGTQLSPNHTTPRTYTTRGWPSEAADLPPSPREIRGFRVWSSTDNSNWSPAGTVSYNNKGGDWTEMSWNFNIVQPSGSTSYYGITALEYSGLESRTLSNIWAITLDAEGNISQQHQKMGYPVNPGGKRLFYTTPPPTIAVQQALGTVNGQYVIKWSAPPDASMIRYYNIYAKDGAVPFTKDTPHADRQRTRIASVPASSDYRGTGAFSYVDWLGATDGTTKYLVTAVDYQGNESLPEGGLGKRSLERVPDPATQ
jgi:hypothetical protein